MEGCLNCYAGKTVHSLSKNVLTMYRMLQTAQVTADAEMDKAHMNKAYPNLQPSGKERQVNR